LRPEKYATNAAEAQSSKRAGKQTSTRPNLNPGQKFHEFPWRGCFFLCHPHAAHTKMI